MEFETVIGLEVHAQLSTKTKIFCSCSTAFGAEPNTHTCPVCLGLPGALPVLNKKAVDLSITLGLALGCDIQNESVWDRKNYFYQDLPKGYQITQFGKPICLRGKVPIVLDKQEKTVPLTRIHMEEDAGKSIHDGADDRFSCVDLNRAGTPLCEIVSEPDLRSPEEAAAYLRSLRSIVRYAGVCDGNMEQGSFRCDANVSIRPMGQKELGTKVELKNLNSIKFVEKALKYEIERQKAAVLDGQEIVQETRLYDPHKDRTETMRSKEDAHDYRYFPDPDLVPLIIDENWIHDRQKNLPELAKAKRDRFITDYQLSEYDAGVLTSDKDLANYYEVAVKTHNNPKKVANWIMTDLLRLLKEKDMELDQCPVQASHLGQLVALIDKDTISGTIAKKVLNTMFETGQPPETIVQEQGLAQVSDTGAIDAAIDKVLAAHPSQVEEYKSGKDKVFGFLMGKVMREMKGKANPGIITKLMKAKLS